MDQIINNEISNSKSVQILRAEQTLESSMKKGGVKMTMNNTKTNGTTTNNGGNEMKSMQQILTELMYQIQIPDFYPIGLLVTLIYPILLF